MDIIPAIDIINGKCVRLSRGDYSKKTVYHDDPVEIAKIFENAGIRRLHIVDLDGARGNSLQNLSSLKRIATATKLIIDFGGGIRTSEAVQAVLDSGAQMINVGSIVVKSPEIFREWISSFGVDRFLPGADVLHKKIMIHGWEENAGVDLFEFLGKMEELGVQQIFCTDISKDGMMRGPSINLYREIVAKFPTLHLVASGGVSGYEDLLALEESGCSGAIIGKAIYEGKITIEQMEKFLKYY